MTAATTTALASHPAIIAVKEASGNLSQVQEILAATHNEDFTVVSGDDALSLPMYSVGSHGVISVASNVVPAAMKAIHQRHLTSDTAGAAAENARLFPLFQALFCESNPVPCKEALAMMGQMNNTVRAPLGALQHSSVERVRTVLMGLKLL